MSRWDDWIGREERRHDVLTQGLIDRFCSTVGGEPNKIAPPGLHWCLCLPDAPMDEIGEDGHPRKGGFFPPIPLPRRMFAGSDITFLAPMRAGANIERVSTIASINEKSGKSGALAFVEVDHLTRADGTDALRERQTLVYRKAATDPLPLPDTSGADLSGWTTTKTITPDAPLLFRYSALTFNTHRIHYDVPYAADAEGYPALVVHGPLMATLLLRLANEQAAGQTITNFAFRAKSPAFASQPLHLVARSEGEA